VSFKRDQKFFDLYSLTIGALALILLAIFVLAMKMSERTQAVFTAATEEFQQAMTERLQPVGNARMPGEELDAGQPQVSPAEPAEPVATTMSGPQVYNAACVMCHGNGIGGAPMLTDGENWAPRIAQGVDTLHNHAINGYAGPGGGYMPPKGGRLDLSDEEIYGAVDYMISEVPR